jgi:uncharacterized protein with PIN domain
MNTATLHFHGELAPLAGRGCIDFPTTRRASAKDAAESLGVPHTEIYGLAVDGQPAHFSHIPAPGELIDIRPAAPPVDVTAPHLERPILPRASFIADANVGRLATYLRLMGFDTLYDRNYQDADVARLSASLGRILLTRDRGVLKRKVVAWGRLVRAHDPVEQARDVVRFFGLAGLAQAFRRCLRCNTLLESAPKADVLHLLEPRTKKYYEEFARCPGCGKVYWAGSHHGKIEEMFGRIRGGEEKE